MHILYLVFIRKQQHCVTQKTYLTTGVCPANMVWVTDSGQSPLGQQGLFQSPAFVKDYSIRDNWWHYDDVGLKSSTTRWLRLLRAVTGANLCTFYWPGLRISSFGLAENLDSSTVLVLDLYLLSLRPLWLSWRCWIFIRRQNRDCWDTKWLNFLPAFFGSPSLLGAETNETKTTQNENFQCILGLWRCCAGFEKRAGAEETTDSWRRWVLFGHVYQVPVIPSDSPSPLVTSVLSTFRTLSAQNCESQIQNFSCLYVSKLVAVTCI
jgi:hypothetical protein